MEQQPGSSEPPRTRTIFTHNTNADEMIHPALVFLQLYSLELRHTGCTRSLAIGCQGSVQKLLQSSTLTVCEVVYEKHHMELFNTAT